MESWKVRNGLLRRRPKRKGRESNPQGCSLARVPGGSRHRSGSPSVAHRVEVVMQSEWSRVDSNHRSSPRQRDVLAAGRRDRFDSLFISTPARIRTRNTSLEARDDRPFHHRGIAIRLSLTDLRKLIQEYLSTENAPTRTRTRDSSLGPRRDRPLHHQGERAEGKGVEPSFPGGNPL
jgi:hypothetical protein